MPLSRTEPPAWLTRSRHSVLPNLAYYLASALLTVPLLQYSLRRLPADKCTTSSYSADSFSHCER